MLHITDLILAMNIIIAQQTEISRRALPRPQPAVLKGRK